MKGSTPSSTAAPDFLWLHLRDLPYFRALLRSVEAQFYQDYELEPPVLDVGCGDGHFATIAFDRPLDVGLDPWGGPIHEAARLGGYKSLVQADGGCMPFPDDYFASSVSNSVLEHIPHVDQVLAETARVLKPGALFLFCVPNPAYLTDLSVPAILRKLHLDNLAGKYTEWFRRISRTEHADSPAVWEARLKRAGFHLEDWWHYFAPQALRVLEWGHYFGAPTLLTRKLTGRWIIAPTRWNLALTMRLIRPYAVAENDPQGTYTFFIARKSEQN